MGLEDRLRRLEQRIQPAPVMGEATRRAMDAILAAWHDGVIGPGVAVDVPALARYLHAWGLSAEDAEGYAELVQGFRRDHG